METLHHSHQLWDHLGLGKASWYSSSPFHTAYTSCIPVSLGARRILVGWQDPAFESQRYIRSGVRKFFCKQVSHSKCWFLPCPYNTLTSLGQNELLPGHLGNLFPPIYQLRSLKPPALVHFHYMRTYTKLPNCLGVVTAYTHAWLLEYGVRRGISTSANRFNTFSNFCVISPGFFTTWMFLVHFVQHHCTWTRCSVP